MTVRLTRPDGRPVTWEELVTGKFDEVLSEFRRPFLDAAAERTAQFLRGRYGGIPRRTGRLRRGIRATARVARGPAGATDLVRGRQTLGQVRIKGTGPHYIRRGKGGGTARLITRAVVGVEQGKGPRGLGKNRRYQRALGRVARRQMRLAAERVNSRGGR